MIQTALNWAAARGTARLAPPVLAASLALLLALLWLLPGPAAQPRHPATLLPPATADAAASAASQWAATALARPLFAPDRRAADQPDATADGTLPRLSAIILTGGGGVAVFAATGQKPQLVGQGGMIDGYVLNRVAPDHIELSGPGGTLALHPQFSTTPSPAAAPSQPPDGEPPPMPGQTLPALNPSSNPALMIEQNY